MEGLLLSFKKTSKILPDHKSGRSVDVIGMKYMFCLFSYRLVIVPLVHGNSTFLTIITV